MLVYYLYSRHATAEAAYEALQRYFAEGVVSAAERPRVVKRGGKWCIQFREQE